MGDVVKVNILDGAVEWDTQASAITATNVAISLSKVYTYNIRLNILKLDAIRYSQHDC